MDSPGAIALGLTALIAFLLKLRVTGLEETGNVDPVLQIVGEAASIQHACKSVRKPLSNRSDHAGGGRTRFSLVQVIDACLQLILQHKIPIAVQNFDAIEGF